MLASNKLQFSWTLNLAVQVSCLTLFLCFLVFPTPNVYTICMVRRVKCFITVYSKFVSLFWWKNSFVVPEFIENLPLCVNVGWTSPLGFCCKTVEA